MGIYVATAKVMRCQAEGCVSNPAEHGQLRMAPGINPEAAIANLELVVAACEKSRANGYHCIMARETIDVREVGPFEFLEAYWSMNDLIGGYGSLR